MATYL
jgi:Putative beta barrel porin-7 (BBP7)